jgi:hypothetical protein
MLQENIEWSRFPPTGLSNLRAMKVWETSSSSLTKVKFAPEQAITKNLNTFIMEGD